MAYAAAVAFIQAGPRWCREPNTRDIHTVIATMEVACG
jgi:hypothetical protein